MRRGASAAIALLMIAGAPNCLVVHASSDANWMSTGGICGVDGAVYATALDGLGNVYIGGDFTVAGTLIANRIAKWDGNSWGALGLGMNGTVRALAVSESDVYAGGEFTGSDNTIANYVARWNGTNWFALGSGLNGPVRALAVSGADVYVGGDFTSAGGNAANYMARWDGSTWAALGTGMNGRVNALTASGGELYAAGSFWRAGGGTAFSVAKWDGTRWSVLGSGLGLNGAYALAVSGSFLYAAYGTGSSGRIDRWNGTSWTSVGSMSGGFIYALAMSGSYLFAGGDGYFTVEGSAVAYGIAKWNPTAGTWSGLGSGMKSTGLPVNALAAVGSDLYAGGRFADVGGTAAKNIAKWNGADWSALGSGMNNSVAALAISDTNIYAGGFFTRTSGTGTNRIARWDGGSWSAVGAGVDGAVSALAISGSNLYAGGRFMTATDARGTNTAVNRVARWNGSRWSPVGAGVNDEVWALAVSGSDLYAGGSFTIATNSPGATVRVNRLAKWNGSSWSALGAGMDNVVFALAVSGTNVYAGGLLTWATNNGGAAVAVNCIARWNGAAWSALGSGVSYGISAVTVSGNNVYAGGSFTTAGANPVSYIAKWDGNTWTALAGGLNGSVRSLAIVGTALYAGGDFTIATNTGGITVGVSRIAEWSDDRWSGLGSGMNNAVSALAPSGNDLYAAGDFTTVGGKVSAYVARAYLLPLPALSAIRFGSSVRVSWLSADTDDFVLEQAEALATPANWMTNAAPVANDGTNKSVTLPVNESSLFFRLQRP